MWHWLFSVAAVRGAVGGAGEGNARVTRNDPRDPYVGKGR